MIKLVVLDVDGTLTDGKLYIDNFGNEMKSFDVKDGLAIYQAIKKGIKIAIITGKTSEIVKRRCEELGIKDVIQGSQNKMKDLKKILEKYKLSLEETAYMGDDLIDLQVMTKCKMSACPKDAIKEVIEISNFVSSKSGGNGAVREFLEEILKNQKIWDEIVLNFMLTKKNI